MKKQFVKNEKFISDKIAPILVIVFALSMLIGGTYFVFAFGTGTAPSITPSDPWSNNVNRGVSPGEVLTAAKWNGLVNYVASAGLTESISVSHTVNQSVDQESEFTVVCPAGYIVTGGSCFYHYHSRGELYISDSSKNGNGWHCEGHNHAGGTSPLVGTAVCSRGSSASAAASTAHLECTDIARGSVSCNDACTALGGGYLCLLGAESWSSPVGNFHGYTRDCTATSDTGGCLCCRVSS